MELGVTLPTSDGPLATPEGITRIAQEAEQLGYAALWTFERLLRPLADLPQLDGRAPEKYRTTCTTVIPAGKRVIPGLLAANRDPSRTGAPATFDLTRTENPHLAFGHGIHHCLGAPLARLEGRIAVGSLLTRFPSLRLAVPAEELTWQPGVVMHGLATLPVVTGLPAGDIP